MSDISRVQIKCPGCRRMVWVFKDEPAGTECPYCGHALGIEQDSTAEVPDEEQDANEQLLEAFQTVPTRPLKNVNPPAEILALVPETIVREFAVLPLTRSADLLRIAVPASIDIRVLETLRFILNCELELMLAEKSEILAAIKRFYG